MKHTNTQSTWQSALCELVDNNQATHQGHNDDLEEQHSLPSMVTSEEEQDDQRIRSSDQHSCK